ERIDFKVPIYFSAGLTIQANMYYKMLINWTIFKQWAPYKANLVTFPATKVSLERRTKILDSNHLLSITPNLTSSRQGSGTNRRSRYLTLRSGYTVKPFSTFPLEIFSRRDSTSRSPLCASNTRVTNVACATIENKATASADSPRSKLNSPSAPNISHSRM
ncbi:Cleavage and polyadenylation specificity factor subunit 3-II, partial [Camellia lanceoleosa]